jgi:hypothetical protein
MKTKPPFTSLPADVQESLLWDMELNYDSYESSQAEAIHSILCGNIYDNNEMVIENYYKALSLDDLASRIQHTMDGAKRTIENCQRLLEA